MKKRFLVVAVVIALIMVTAGPVFADHQGPGKAGQTKFNIYDNTNNGWNVNTLDPVTSTADPVIGFVNFNPIPDDPNHIEIVVSLKDAAPNCTFDIEVVTDGIDPDGGLAPDANHSGFITDVGHVTTNGNGKGNSSSIVVDVNTVNGAAPSGSRTWAHIDVENKFSAACTEEDGTSVAFNEYGASSAPGVIFHWVQP